jgi:hypothetical protein
MRLFFQAHGVVDPFPVTLKGTLDIVKALLPFTHAHTLDRLALLEIKRHLPVMALSQAVKFRKLRLHPWHILG